MKGHIFIIFDKAHDKDWLVEELSEHYGCSRISVIRLSISSVEMEVRAGAWGKMLNLYHTIQPSIRVLLHSKKDDIIICWGAYAGVIVNLLSRITLLNRKLIFPGWLTPVKRQKTYLLSKFAATNKNCHITITSPELEALWEKHLNIKSIGNFHYLPDMFEDNLGYRSVQFRRDGYYFSGGMANRDWGLLMKIATALPTVKFKCIALQKDFEQKVSWKPDNVEVFYNTDSNTYYELMSNAKCILLPLFDCNIVSGLINIIRSAQHGIPCYVTKTIATSQYYEDMDFLLKNNAEEWIRQIKKIEGLNAEEFIRKTECYQNYIRYHFSRERIAIQFIDIIEKIK